MRVGCYPGSFNPPTVGHLAIAEEARRHGDLDRVDLVVSRVALGKEHVVVPAFDERLRVLRQVVAARSSWLGLVVTDRQLLVEVAAGYDVLVLGADKWEQVLDPRFYGGSTEERDRAVAALPPLALAPRPGFDHVTPPADAMVLDVPPEVAPASSTAARAGRIEWMAPEAAASGLWAPDPPGGGRGGT